jgi:transposase
LWRETTYASLSTYTAVAKVPLLRIEIVKRSDDMKGFVLLPRRWVVERTSQDERKANAHCARRTSRGSRAPETLWRHEARCVLAGGRACPARAPGCFICERGPETAAELVACAPQSLIAGCRDHLGSTLAMLREVRRRAGDFDVIHFHVDLLPQALFHDLAHKCLVTLHGRLDLPDALPLYKAYPEMPLVSISNAQRRPMPPAIGSRQSRTAFRRASVRSARMAAAIWLSSDVSRPKSARTGQ